MGGQEEKLLRGVFSKESEERNEDEKNQEMNISSIEYLGFQKFSRPGQLLTNLDL